MQLHYELPVIAIFAQYDPIVFVSSMDSYIIIIIIAHSFSEPLSFAVAKD
jgi:hypothetical protein